jgi:hypothetical protein
MRRRSQDQRIEYTIRLTGWVSNKAKVVIDAQFDDMDEGFGSLFGEMVKIAPLSHWDWCEDLKRWKVQIDVKTWYCAEIKTQILPEVLYA